MIKLFIQTLKEAEQRKASNLGVLEDIIHKKLDLLYLGYKKTLRISKKIILKL